ncbi:MAG: hypothetical protein V3S41_10250 [Spirochaetia bacterium]
MKTLYLTGAALAVLLLGACVTAPPSQNEGRVAEVIALINDGSVEALVNQSHVPFFFDAELLVRSTDVALMWSGLREAGFEIEPIGYALEPAGPPDYRRIADTFDMESFFSPDGYLPDDAGWVVVDTSAGEMLILLGDRIDRLPVIFGIARSSHE